MGGPGPVHGAFAVAMGFADVDDLLERRPVLRSGLHEGTMAAADWRRVVLATEVVFASDLVGSGLDWCSTTGRSDEATIATLRAIQRKLPVAVRTAGR